MDLMDCVSRLPSEGKIAGVRLAVTRPVPLILASSASDKDIEPFTISTRPMVCSMV
ncbi:hypothetical protein D3C79_861710 [compost metagenome]